jgi:hypothetical protein
MGYHGMNRSGKFTEQRGKPDDDEEENRDGDGDEYCDVEAANYGEVD